MEERVMALLGDICGVEAAELEADLNLFDSGLLDSFAMVELLVELEAQFGVSLDIELLAREDIATPALLVRRIAQAG